MNELVMIWRDQKANVRNNLTQWVNNPYEGGPYYHASYNPIGAVSFGEICTAYNKGKGRTVYYEEGVEEISYAEQGDVYQIGGHFGGATFYTGYDEQTWVENTYSQANCHSVQFGYIQCEAYYQAANTLEVNSAKSFTQHIMDEVKVRGKEYTPESGIFITQNFASRPIEGDRGTSTFYGARVTKDNVEVLNSSGVRVETLNIGDYVWFNFGISATYGNSKKTHMGVWGISKGGVTAPIKNYYGGQFIDMSPDRGAYMYVATGMGTAQYTGNWEQLNIATMPVNGMTQDDAKWGLSGL